MLNSRIVKDRLQVIGKRLKKSKVDCLVVVNPANVTYSTGFLGDDSWALITSRNSYLLTDSRYTEQAKTQCPSCKIIQRTSSLSIELAKLTKKLRSIRVVSVENSASIATLQALRKNLSVKVKPVADIIEPVRAIKGADEIVEIKAAADIAGKALKKIFSKMKPGVTENELAGMLDLEIRRSGATTSFETIVAFGPNGSMAHHRPSGKKLRKNDTILIDFGAKYNGYSSDVTRCFSIGKETNLYRKTYAVVLKAQRTAIEMIKPCVKFSKIDAACRKMINDNSLPVYGHGTGHGLGLEVHEQPIISIKSKGKAKAGMVFTIEPGVYIPGKLGIRIEDDILVTENGYEVLTGKISK